MKSRSNCRRSPASSPPSPRRRCRTSICWPRAGAFPTLTSRNAQELFKQYDGWWVTFETKRDSYSIKRADIDQLREYQKRMAERLDVMKPRYDLSEKRLLDLAQQRKAMSIAYGGKSANLGEVMHARSAGHRRSRRVHDSFLLLRRVS